MTYDRFRATLLRFEFFAETAAKTRARGYDDSMDAESANSLRKELLLEHGASLAAIEGYRAMARREHNEEFDFLTLPPYAVSLECDYCHILFPEVLYDDIGDCKYCGLLFCPSCQNPESHKCEEPK